MSGLLVLASACQPVVEGHAPVTIFAASSLIDVVADLNQAFCARDLACRVAVQTAGSQTLRMQIEQGAKAALFASANHHHAQALAGQGLLGEPRLFARNRLVLISPKSAPVQWRDLPQVQRLGLGLPEVPIGAYSEALLQAAKHHFGAAYAQAVRQRIRRREASVRLLRSRVELGGLDAAIVYASDAMNRESLVAVEPPAPMQQRSELWIGKLASHDNEQAADDWLAFLHGKKGSSILRKHGFDLP